MNRFPIATLLILLSVLPAAAQEPADEQVIVTIGDKATITKTEFERALTGAMQARMAQARRLGVSDPHRLAQMPNHEEKLNLLDTMIDSKILYILAQEAGVKVTDEEINAEIEKNSAALPPNVTIEQFMEKQGISMAEIEELTRMRLMSRAFGSEKVKDLTISDEEVEAEYEKLKERHLVDTADISHILVRVANDDPGAWEEGKKKIDAAYKRIKDGDDFAEVAKEYSEDENTRDDGGVIKGAMRGILGPEFDQRMFELPLNEVTEPFKTRVGWHIMKVTERGTAPLEGLVKERLSGALLQQKKAQAIEKLVSDARSTMSVNITLPPDAPSALDSVPIQAPSILDGAT